MKKLKVTEENVLNAASQSPLAKSIISKLFPEVFKEELKVGKWYRDKVAEKSRDICLLNFQGIDEDCYGFWGGIFDSGYVFIDENNPTPATDKEVEKALIKEWERDNKSFAPYEFKDGVLYGNDENFGCRTLFCDGVFTEIVEEKKEEKEQLFLNIINPLKKDMAAILKDSELLPVEEYKRATKATRILNKAINEAKKTLDF